MLPPDNFVPMEMERNGRAETFWSLMAYTSGESIFSYFDGKVMRRFWNPIRSPQGRRVRENLTFWRLRKLNVLSFRALTNALDITMHWMQLRKMPKRACAIWQLREAWKYWNDCKFTFTIARWEQEKRDQVIKKPRVLIRGFTYS